MSDKQQVHHERQKLDRAFVGGMAWTAGAKWLSQLISWPSVLITARFLSTADFGIVEMAGVYFIVTNVMAEFGIGMAVLQMQELDSAIVAQLNSVAFLSGLLAFGLSVAAAPLIAQFFHAPELHKLVIVTSLSFILTSFEAIPLGLLQRDMDYRRLSVAESLQAVITAVVSVTCAYSGWAYWSLIAGNLAGRAANVALIWYWRGVPFAIPRWKQVLAPLHFGMEIAVQRIAGSICGLSDGIVIGRTLTPSLLGMYRFAMNLASTPSDKIGALIMRVTGPLFARVQTDPDAIRRYFLIFSETLAMALFPLVLGLAVVAPEAVQLLLPPNWAGAAGPLRWLAIFMAVRTMAYLVNQLVTTLRLTRFGMWMTLLSLVVMPIAFIVGSRWGVSAIAAAWLVMSPVTVIPVAMKVFPAIRCTLRQYLGSLAPALAGSSVMLLAVIAFRSWWIPSHWPTFVRLSAEIAVGGCAYAAIIWGFYRARVMQYVRFFLQLRTTAGAVAAG